MSAAQLDLGDRQQQLRIVAGRLDRQVFGGGLQVAARDERARQAARAARRRPDRRRAASRSVSSASSSLALRLERRGERPELLERRRALAGAREIAGGDVDVEQLLADLVVVRRSARRLAQRFERLGRPVLRRTARRRSP